VSIRDETPRAEQRRGGKASIAMFLFLLVIVFCLSFYVYAKSRNEEFENIFNNVNIKEWVLGLFEGKSPVNSINKIKGAKEDEDDEIIETEYDMSSHPVFGAYKEQLIKCIKDSIKGLNAEGKEVWQRSINAGNPMFKTNGTDMLVADIGGKDIYIFNGNNIKWEKRIDNKIINADINEKGYVTVIHEAEGFKCAVSAFDPDGVEMFRRFIADSYVLAAKMAPSGKQFLINAVNISGINAYSYIEFFDNYEKPYAGLKQDEIMAQVQYLKDGSVFAAGPSKAICFDKEGKEKWAKDFPKIYSADTSAGKYIILAVAGNGNSGILGRNDVEVQVLNTRGQLVSAYSVADEVKNIACFEEIIAVNTGREVHFVDTGGELVRRFAFKSDVINVQFFSKEKALVVTKNSTAVVKIKL